MATKEELLQRFEVVRLESEFYRMMPPTTEEHPTVDIFIQKKIIENDDIEDLEQVIIDIESRRDQILEEIEKESKFEAIQQKIKIANSYSTCSKDFLDLIAYYNAGKTEQEIDELEANYANILKHVQNNRMSTAKKLLNLNGVDSYITQDMLDEFNFLFDFYNIE